MNVIDFDAIAAVISLSSDAGWDYPDFMANHVGEWREIPLGKRIKYAHYQSVNPELSWTVHSKLFMHYMRSFTAMSPYNRSAKKPPELGIKCEREHINLKSPFDGKVLQLVERRYSTALNMLPCQGPAGNYALVSVLDCGSTTSHEGFSFDDSRAHRAKELSQSWRLYKLYSAGLFTGIANLQLQICGFVDAWEKDWKNTLNKIDEMLSVKVSRTSSSITA